MLKDMMTGFELYQPADVAGALDLMARHAERGWVLAGGHDSLSWFKDRAKAPEAVIDLEGIAELLGIRETPEGIEIGAMTTLTEVERSPLVRERWGLLAEAAASVASPQIRNTGTLGGNLCQDTRCWYYRSGVRCYRAGGNTCYAAAPQAMNREHAIFGASRCVAVTPTDCGVALVALDAQMVVRNREGIRTIAAADFFMAPSVDIQRMTALEPGDLLVAVRLPQAWTGAAYYFEKVTDRGSWDFALVSVAAAFRSDGDGIIDDARIVCGGVQCVPRRMTDVEGLARGRARGEELANEGAAIAARGAEPLRFNQYKVALTENLVRRALRG